MKRNGRTPLPVLAIGLCLVLTGRVTAQTFRVLHSFSLTDTNGVNSDGISPMTDLLLLGKTLYGTAFYGGTSGHGTVFAVNTDGTSFRTLHNFSADGYGYFPCSELVSAGNTLYGTAFSGNNARWAVFAVNTDGTGFGTFDYLAGGMPFPEGGLALSGSTLYGTTPFWPLTGYVKIFAVATGGGGFTVLHTFNDFQAGAGQVATLLLGSNTLYGTTQIGGPEAYGTVFKLNTDGSAFKVLHSFTNIDGYPSSALIRSGDTLYGTTSAIVFKINTDGTAFAKLHDFSGDGAYSYARLVLSGSALYGTTYSTVFSLNTDGTGFRTLHKFSGSDGDYVTAGLVLFGNTLYGAANGGGSADTGTIFSISVPPELTITPSAANVILTWPTNALCFLESTTNLGSPVWTSNSAAPVVVDGLNTVTNPISGTQQFFRLSQ